MPQASSSHNKPGSGAKGIGIILLVIALGILLYPFAMKALTDHGFIKEHNYSSSIEGTVTQRVEDGKTRSETFIIAYTVNDVSYTTDEQISESLGEKKLSIGEKLTVRYDPDNPAESTVSPEDTTPETYKSDARNAAAGFFGFFGLGFLGFGIYSSKRSRDTA